MTRTKLAIIIGRFGIGGAENMVYELIKNIDQTLFDVHVLCYMPRCNTHMEIQAEKVCKIHFLDIEGRVGIAAIRKVLSALSEINPDVVHAHMGGVVFGAIWTMIHRKALVVTIHTKPENEFTAKIMCVLKLRMMFHKWMLVAVSQENVKLVKQFYGVNEEKCICIENGVDVNRFYRKEHKYFTMINLARQDENKNQEEILRCFSRVHQIYNNTELILAGDGPTHRKLIDLAIELDLMNSVHFPGMVTNAEDYYAVSDLYVQSSHVEAMPLSVLEAMAAGLPIVSTDVGGLRDVVQNNGILVPDNDEQALFDAMITIMNATQEEKSDMGKTSKMRVAKYSSVNMSKRYMDIYGIVSKR